MKTILDVFCDDRDGHRGHEVRLIRVICWKSFSPVTTSLNEKEIKYMYSGMYNLLRYHKGVCLLYVKARLTAVSFHPKISVVTSWMHFVNVVSQELQVD